MESLKVKTGYLAPKDGEPRIPWIYRDDDDVSLRGSQKHTFNLLPAGHRSSLLSISIFYSFFSLCSFIPLRSSFCSWKRRKTSASTRVLKPQQLFEALRYVRWNWGFVILGTRLVLCRLLACCEESVRNLQAVEYGGR